MNFTARKQSTDRTGILWNRRKKALHIWCIKNTSLNKELLNSSASLSKVGKQKVNRYERRLSITSHRGNTNQTENEILFILIRMLPSKRQVLARMWTNENLRALLVGMYNDAAAMENNSFQQIEIELTDNPGIHFWLFIKRNWNQDLKRSISTPMFFVEPFIITVKMWKLTNAWTD